MNSVTIKVIGFIVSLFIIVTVVSQMVINFKDKPDTEEVGYAKISNSVNFKGIFIRNEIPLDSTADGIVNYLYSDGSKVAQGATVAKVYSSEDSVIKKKQIADIDYEIDNLGKIINQGTEIIAQPEFISTQIDTKYQDLQYYLAHNNIAKVKELKSDINVLMGILNLLTKVEPREVFETRINDLNAQKEQIESTLSQTSTDIVADRPGYFVGYTDGYENTLNKSNAESLTADQINEITSSDINNSDKNIGKIIDSYSCNIVGIVTLPTDMIKSKNLRIRVIGSSYTNPVELEKIDRIDKTDKYKIVLSCDEIRKDLLSNRVEDIELVFNEYAGIKVPRKAIRFKDGVKGVYVMVGQDVRFKKLDILYEGKDFVISKSGSDNDYVVLYDNVLLEEVKQYETSGTTTVTTESTTTVP